MENYSSSWETSGDEDGGGVDGEAFRALPRPGANRLVPRILTSRWRRLEVFRGRKHYTSQNMLAVVDFDMRFTYVLAGWEGSAHDASIPADNLSRPDGLQIPEGWGEDEFFEEVVTFDEVETGHGVEAGDNDAWKVKRQEWADAMWAEATPSSEKK
ncbi:hypothetical protein QYE76_070853 [Lolium multiflorum]|uniref:DDE Tnp4 domain-containing protein n=1 Tax=Lolium multiflorum TaxID=4521 RepID=A0AAD8SK59_LOLMU|nr:hypothetical protein QYE76_070853 [Lolium multiflorum]